MHDESYVFWMFNVLSAMLNGHSFVIFNMMGVSLGSNDQVSGNDLFWRQGNDRPINQTTKIALPVRGITFIYWSVTWV